MPPQAKEFQGDPLDLSYWLASNLPLEDDTRQKLLEAGSAAERLRSEIDLLHNMAVLHCRGCHSQVSHCKVPFGTVFALDHNGTHLSAPLHCTLFPAVSRHHPS